MAVPTRTASPLLAAALLVLPLAPTGAGIPGMVPDNVPSVAPPGEPRVAEPVNDDLAASLPLQPYGTIVGTTQGATLEPGEPQPCGEIGQTVWFTFVAPDSGTYDFATDNSYFDTVMAAYNGDTYPLTLKACNDDAFTHWAFLRLRLAAGEVVRIQLGGWGDLQGLFYLRVEPVVHTGRPLNDDFWDRLPVTAPGTMRYTTRGATLETGEPRPCSFIGSTVWFTFVAPAPGTVAVATFDANFNAILAAYHGDGYPLTPKACHDDPAGLDTRIAFPVAAGEVVHVQLGGYLSSGGEYTLLITPG